ncbi:hypothetical protein C6P95_01175 [Burkholderia multivorans]|nr:hypothetical protein C6P95_01175 [Burkholderia multivorans]
MALADNWRGGRICAAGQAVRITPAAVYTGTPHARGRRRTAQAGAAQTRSERAQNACLIPTFAPTVVPVAP